ncbi:MAG: GHKL domain-containing protein, partial [Gammaproteobacteria bacterium]|nr:GHKL domain-containing protein [Gammaproteobacteria bacterium]
QFEQVLLNIIRNAIDALASLEQDLKVIEISVVQDDQCIVVKIEDNGDGISKEISSQLFKPFFTTKDNGMGIGLSTSLSLIEAMEGTILARNRLERGACFTITLPVLGKVMA